MDVFRLYKQEKWPFWLLLLICLYSSNSVTASEHHEITPETMIKLVEISENVEEEFYSYSLAGSSHETRVINITPLVGNVGFRIFRYVGNCDCVENNCVIEKLSGVLRKNNIRYIDVICLNSGPDENLQLFIRFRSKNEFVYLNMNTIISTKGEQGLQSFQEHLPENLLNAELIKNTSSALIELFNSSKSGTGKSVQIVPEFRDLCKPSFESSSKSYAYEMEASVNDADSSFGSAESQDHSDDSHDFEQPDEGFDSEIESDEVFERVNKSISPLAFTSRVPSESSTKTVRNARLLNSLKIENRKVFKNKIFDKDGEKYSYSLCVTGSHLPGCNGLGVFAETNIQKGAVIGKISNKLKSRSSRHRIDKATNIHTIFINDVKGNLYSRKPGKRCAFHWLNMAVNLGNPEQSPTDNITLHTPKISGSKESGWTGDTLVLATQPIQAGDELLFSYDTKSELAKKVVAHTAAKKQP